MRPSIILFGDSLTELAFGTFEQEQEGYQVGWASLLASAYSRRADVLNQGYRGYNTGMALQILPQVLKDQPRPLFCTVWWGANDAVLPEDPRHVPVDEFGENLKQLVTMIRERFQNNSSTTPPIILLTPPPLDLERRQEFCLSMYGNLDRARRSNDLSRQYAQKVEQVAKEMRCSLVNVFDLLGGHGSVHEYRDNLVDGLHLSSKGSMAVYKGLVQVIQRDHPELAPLKDNGKQGIPLEQKQWNEFFQG